MTPLQLWMASKLMPRDVKAAFGDSIKSYRKVKELVSGFPDGEELTPSHVQYLRKHVDIDRLVDALNYEGFDVLEAGMADDEICEILNDLISQARSSDNSVDNLFSLIMKGI